MKYEYQVSGHDAPGMFVDEADPILVRGLNNHIYDRRLYEAATAVITFLQKKLETLFEVCVFFYARFASEVLYLTFYVTLSISSEIIRVQLCRNIPNLNI